MSEAALRDLFLEVEKYVSPLINQNSATSGQLSREENRILALQQINRLNQRIGQLARASQTTMQDYIIVQKLVNNLTVGVKSDNVQQIKYSLSSLRNYVS